MNKLSEMIGVKDTITGELLNLTNVISEIAPEFTQKPSNLALVANTHAPTMDVFGDVEFVYSTKSTAKLIYKNGALVTNPELFKAIDLELEFARLRPERLGNKYKLSAIDYDSKPELLNVLSQKAISFMKEIHIDNESLEYNNLAHAATEFQAKISALDNTCTTFITGAHVEENTFTNGKQVLEKLDDVTEAFTNIGTIHANNILDKNFKLASGLQIENSMLYISKRFLTKIAADHAMFPMTESPNKLFSLAGIKSLHDMNVLVTSKLPKGVNFMLISTGELGAVGYGHVAKGFEALITNGQWKFDKELQTQLSQYLGVVFPQLVFISIEPGTKIEKLDMYKNAVMSQTSYATSTTNDGEIKGINEALDALNSNEQNHELTAKQKARQNKSNSIEKEIEAKQIKLNEQEKIIEEKRLALEQQEKTLQAKLRDIEQQEKTSQDKLHDIEQNNDK